ncbi:hypothetical protein [Aminobacter sp. HY435]|uniref:hypothetical protein n=1 Tax=Aminobacter sp. HY435 TaxID=2970917 RepID=UPI0022B97910|nr:hypothetical protein [Aminobacter sp. HY435]
MHLFVIVTNQCQNGFHLLVSLTSIKPGKAHDPTCTFNGGEHPFIDKPTYVYYRLAEQRSSASIVKAVDAGLFVPRVDMLEGHLAAICSGIEQSEFIGSWAIEYYQENRNN